MKLIGKLQWHFHEVALYLLRFQIELNLDVLNFVAGGKPKTQRKIHI